MSEIEELTDTLVDTLQSVNRVKADLVFNHDTVKEYSHKEIVAILNKYKHDENFRFLPLSQEFWKDFPECVPLNADEFSQAEENITLRDELDKCKNRSERRQLMRTYLKEKKRRKQQIRG